MPRFMTPLVYQGPHFRRDDRPWMKSLRLRQTRPITGINLYVLKDEYVNETWKKVSHPQPPSPDWIEREYMGARIYHVTDEEAELLLSFGYPMLPIEGGYGTNYPEGY